MGGGIYYPCFRRTGQPAWNLVHREERDTLGLGGSDPQAVAASANQRGGGWEQVACPSARAAPTPPRLSGSGAAGTTRPAPLLLCSEPSHRARPVPVTVRCGATECQGGIVTEPQDMVPPVVAHLQGLPRNSLQMVKYSESLKITLMQRWAEDCSQISKGGGRGAEKHPERKTGRLCPRQRKGRLARQTHICSNKCQIIKVYLEF